MIKFTFHLRTKIVPSVYSNRVCHLHTHTHTHTHTHPNVPFDTVVLSSEVSFALKGMQENISVTVHVTLRRHVCVVLQALDLLQRTSTVYNV